MDAHFSVTPTWTDNCRLLVLEGDLDMEEADVLDAALAESSEGVPVIVDLTSLTFVGSAGLRVLLQERDVGRPAAIVRNPGSSVARVLDIVDSQRTIPVYDDVAAALEVLSGYGDEACADC